jgi:hypothetical protein
MKERLLFFLLLLLSMGTLTTSAESSTLDSIELTLNIDDPSHVDASLYNDSVLSLKTGANVFKVSPWTNITFTAKIGYILDKVTDSDGNEQTIEDYLSTCMVMIADSPSKCTYTVKTSPVTNINFTLTIDHANKVKVNTADYTSLTVKDGDNQLAVASNKLPLSISAATWDDSFYEVLLDGQPVSYNYGYSINPHDGSVIKVTTKFPDKDCSLTFQYPMDIDKFFTAVSVDDSIITDFANGLNLKAGKKVRLYYNPTLWNSDPEQAVNVSVNGEKTSWFGPGYSIVMRDNTLIKVIQAVAVPTIKVKVKINKDNAATIYRSSQTYYDTVALKANEEQIIEFPEDDGNKIVVKVNDDNETIKGINLNGEPVSLDGNNYAEVVDLVDGDSISIVMNGAVTEIHALTRVQKEGTVYNLQGQRVNNTSLTKGVYVQNGKKIIRN